MQVKEFLEEKLGIYDEQLLNYLLKKVKILNLHKRQLLFRMGEKPTILAFLNQGITRGYFVDQEGTEITDCFDFRQGSPIVPSLPLDAPARVDIEAITDCEFFCLPIYETIKLLDRDPFFINLYNKFLLISLKECLDLKNVLHRYGAFQRYQWFLKTYPDLEGKVRERHIASLLGITEEHLCRQKNLFYKSI